MPQVFECMVGNRALVIETGRLACQADGAVTVRYGDTLVLVTACTSSKPREGVDFLPLTVDYEEKHYAAGKIPGSYIRREARPSQDAILADRLTDRSLRPLFPKGFRNETQVVITVLSADQESNPDILAIIGASAALSLSSIPFEGPLGAVRIGFINGELVLNPTFAQLNDSTLDIVIAGTSDAVIMVEAGAREVSESLILDAIKFGQEANQEIIRLQQQLREACGKPKMDFESHEIGQEVVEAVSSILQGRLDEVIYKPKAEREDILISIKEELVQKLGESFPQQDILSALESQLKRKVRSQILERGVRTSGRQMTEVRPITCEVGFLPRTHGSGLFTRGGTQVLTTTTLGSVGDEQLIDTISQEETKRFIHHYNFPPYSVGEVRRTGAPGRREIGHGALAERALTPVLPDNNDFLYTIRLVSEVLSSNGSTSMASVCSSSLALMDAGVPIKSSVAGVAMGLVSEDDKYVLLTDIEGLEDAYGDMDFKVAGTSQGLTALQMDIKLKGVSYEVIERALEQAHDARLFILDKMNQTLNSSRPDLSRYAPRVYKIAIAPDRIGTVIGPGGRMIRSIIKDTKATIDIENDGTVLIGSVSEEGAQKAIKIIESLTREVEVGAIYTGRVTRVTNFGAFVEILPGKEG
ncbi:MAG: polyribonucleotide nucleotidyltransferase, partial [Dehalococcoidia bacterium]|nr:polyribonucleotide nucleotidyltransferase [Dehalococcoidia bacterium]